MSGSDESARAISADDLAKMPEEARAAIETMQIQPNEWHRLEDVTRDTILFLSSHGFIDVKRLLGDPDPENRSGIVRLELSAEEHLERARDAHRRYGARRINVYRLARA